MIRYPKMSCPTELECFSQTVMEGRGVLVSAMDYEPSFAAKFEDSLYKPQRVLFVTTGGMFSETITAGRALAFKDIIADIYSLRFIKPFDDEYFLSIAAQYDAVVIVEDGIKTGGISEYIASVCARNGVMNIAVKAFPERFYEQGSRHEVCEAAGMTADDLKETALQLLKKVKR